MTVTVTECRFPQVKGRTGYRKGCRCDRCHDDNMIYQRDYNPARVTSRTVIERQRADVRARVGNLKRPTDVYPPRA